MGGRLLALCCAGLCLVVQGCRERATAPAAGAAEISRKAALTESNVRERVITGMSRQAVISTFGEPDLTGELEDGTVSLTYLLPTEKEMRLRNFEFSGFDIFLRDGKVIDWSPIHSSTLIQAPTARVKFNQRASGSAPDERQPVLSFYAVQTATNTNYKYIDTDLLPKLGYISDKPELVIDQLNGMSYGQSRQLKRNSQTNEDEELIQPSVSFQFQPSTAEAFHELTKRHVGKRILATIDDFPVAAPTVWHPIEAPGITINFQDETQFAKAKPYLERLSAIIEK